MLELLPLTVVELDQLHPQRTGGSGKEVASNARSVAPEKSWAATYEGKMDAFVRRAQILPPAPGASSCSGGKVALDALCGRDLIAVETGFVTTVDNRGHVMHNVRLQ